MAEDKAPKPAETATAPPPPPEGEKPGKAPGKKAGKPKLQISNLAPREKTLLTVTMIVISVLLVDLLVIKPVSNYLRYLTETIQIKEEIIPKRLLILRYKDRILKEYEGLKPLITEPGLTQEEEIAQLLREIERVSKEVNLFVSNINPVKVNKISDAVYELSVDIEGKAGMSQVRQFIKTIEAANPSICVNGFTLKPQSKESEDLKFSFSILKVGVKKIVTPPSA